jgi:hypothetical protein
VPEPAHDTAVLCAGWYPNDGNGQAMNVDHALIWAYGSLVRLGMRSYTRMPVRFSVDGRPRLKRTVSLPVESVPVPLGRPGWHLISLDTGTLPTVNGRKEGPRVLSYVLG